MIGSEYIANFLVKKELTIFFLLRGQLVPVLLSLLHVTKISVIIAPFTNRQAPLRLMAILRHQGNWLP